MIRRLRSRVGLFLSLGLLLVGWTATLTATQPVTWSQMESFVYRTLAIAALPVILGSAGLLAWVLKRDRDLQRESAAQIVRALSELGGGLSRAVRALEDHNNSATVHPALADRMQAHSDRVEKKIDDLIEDCRVHRCGYGPRNPLDSPNKRRSTDPRGVDDSGDDFRVQRGAAK